MAANLAKNIKAALKDINIRSVTDRTWIDRTVVLHWFRDQGNYKVFVENKVKKISWVMTEIESSRHRKSMQPCT